MQTIETIADKSVIKSSKLGLWAKFPVMPEAVSPSASRFPVLSFQEARCFVLNDAHCFGVAVEGERFLCHLDTANQAFLALFPGLGEKSDFAKWIVAQFFVHIAKGRAVDLSFAERCLSEFVYVPSWAVFSGGMPNHIFFPFSRAAESDNSGQPEGKENQECASMYEEHLQDAEVVAGVSV
ncbi:MAG: hypothetical protein LBS65_05295 [Desulfovibrio sp.]|jgi:hypothetical protein|nr:hypothetical protein [Desulfovibrio sp.]